MRAPVPAALPADLNLGQIAIRDQAQHHGVFHVDVGAKRSGQADFIDVGDFQFIHQQLHTRIKRGFCHLDGAHVVLRDPDQRFVGLIRGLADDVIKSALVGFNTGAPSCKRAIDEAILIDDARKVHLSDGLNDA